MEALRDIHTPPMPDGLSVWPPVAAAMALVLVLALLAILLMRTRRRWATELKQGIAGLDATQPDQALTEAAKLLRRAAIMRHGQAARRVQGDGWLAMLDQLFRTRFFTSGAGRLFGVSLYEPALSKVPANEVLAELKRLAARREWMP